MSQCTYLISDTAGFATPWICLISKEPASSVPFELEHTHRIIRLLKNTGVIEGAVNKTTKRGAGIQNASSSSEA